MPVNNALAESIGTGQSEDPFKRVLEYGQFGNQQSLNRLREAQIGAAGASAAHSMAGAAYERARTGLVPTERENLLARTATSNAETKRFDEMTAGEKATNASRIGSVIRGGASVDDTAAFAKSIGHPIPEEQLAKFRQDPSAFQAAGVNLTNFGMTGQQGSALHTYNPYTEGTTTAVQQLRAQNPSAQPTLTTQPPSVPSTAGTQAAPAAAWPGGQPPVQPAPQQPAPAPAVQPTQTGMTSMPLLSPQGQAVAKGMGGEIVAHQKQALDNYQAAAKNQYGMADLEKSLAEVPDNGFWNGTGAGERASLAKAVNTAAASFGMQPIFDQNKISATEAAKKGTTRLGFDLARSLGSREAMMVVQQSIGVQPGIEQTKQGQQKIMASLNVASQMDKDYLPFLNQYMKQNPDALPGDARIAFTRTHPVAKYVNDAKTLGAVPLVDIRDLREHPERARDFNQYYGHGSDIARYLVEQ